MLDPLTRAGKRADWLRIGLWTAGALILAMLALMGSRVAWPNHASAASAYTLTPVEFGMQLKTPDGRVVFESLVATLGKSRAA